MERAKEQPVKKKPYDAPALVRYGDLVEVTQSIPHGKGNHDSLGGDNKTA